MRVLVLLLLTSCVSMPDAVILPAASYHFDRETELATKQIGDYFVKTIEREVDYNEFNPGLGFDWQLDPEWRLEAGAFVNSFEDLAPYVGANWLAYQNENFEFGISLALAYYESEESRSDLVPFVGPMGSVRLGPVWLRGMIGPRDGGTYLASVSLRIPLDRREE